MPITNDVIFRTFQITFGEKQGTCFAVDYENRQYIVTARHLVETITDSATIYITHEKVRKACSVDLVGHCEGEVDISVLTANIRLAPPHPLPPSSNDILLGQDVFFLGFPYGLTSEIAALNRNFPVPLIKKAIVSALESETMPFLLDGHNNPGFSGGPVVYSGGQANEFSVAGVISGFHPRDEPVFLEGKRTLLEYEYNTGIIIAYGIKYATELIRQNPIGFELGDQSTS